MQRLRSNSAHFWAPKKAGVMQPLLILPLPFFFFLKNVVRLVPRPTPPAPPWGFETYINYVLKKGMFRPGWGATGKSGRELTRGCYALHQKYHLPCPPPCCKNFLPTYMPQNDQHDEAVILIHTCCGPGAPPLPPAPRPRRPSPPPAKWEGVGVWPVATPPPPPVEELSNTFKGFMVQRNFIASRAQI